MTPFFWKFGDLAMRETRSILIRGRSDLPDGEYALVESYCEEPGCDCRRGLFQIFARGRDEPLAFIGYGWELREFYAARTGGLDEDFYGPDLEPMAPRPKRAAGFLDLVRVALSDPDYVVRLKRHYAMCKSSLAGDGSPSGDATSPQRGE